MTDSILIVGGGVAGLHAAMECANAGARAVLVEQQPVVGGKLAAAMTQPAAIGDRAEGTGTPLFETLSQNENIEIMTLANLQTIEGRPGNFTVSIRERARFVTDDCTRCKLCRAVCPVVLANEFDAGLTYRKAIYTPMAETLPTAYVVDTESCLNTPPNYLPCRRCVEACDDDAIDFHQALDTVHERHVGAIILAPGFQMGDTASFSELGYGTHPDVVMSAELQRLLESPGPTGGYASKPSNEEYPESVLLVLDNLSHFGLYIVASQVHQLLEQDVTGVAVLVLAAPAAEKEYSEVTELVEKTGIPVHWGATFKVDPTEDETLTVSYEDLSTNRYVRESYDMIVLCSDVQPPDGLPALARTTGVDLSESGYLATAGEEGIAATTQPGIFVAGCASGPKNIKRSIADAQAAAAGALAQLNPRLLNAEAATQQKEEDADVATQDSPDEMRKHIEQLLYALIGQSDR